MRPLLVALGACALAAVTACGCGGGSAGDQRRELGDAASHTPVAATPSPTIEPAPSFTPTPTAAPQPTAVEETYRDIAPLYAGEFGIYRSCSPNGGVCHNSLQYPNLRSLESVLDTIGSPCNQLRDDPLQVHDWCELAGDRLRIGNREIEIGSFEVLDAEGLQWVIHLRDAPPSLAGQEVSIVRHVGAEIRTLYRRLHTRTALRAVSANQGGPGVFATLPPFSGGERDDSLLLWQAFTLAGVPGNPTGIQVGDPNRNGIFGADLGNALVLPGDPTRSYLVRRLIDPNFGTLMPLANCCFWTKASLRALWCWVAGLAPDGSNALDPIDYAGCPDGPVENVIYPEPGPTCETAGMCPVRPGDTEPGVGFASVFAIMRSNCAGASCHIGGNAGGFVIPTEESPAYDAVLTRVRPGSPEQSLLYVRLDRDLCDLPSCIPMPQGQPPLPADQLAVIRQWIADGVPR